MFLVAAAVTLSGCKDDEPTLPEQPPQQPQNSSELVGTTWEANLENDFAYQGVTMHIDLLSMLDFTELTKGELFMDINITVPAIPGYPPQHQSETEEFSYTFDGSNLLLTQSYTNEQTGQTTSYDIKTVYDKQAETITVDFDDDEMAAIMGTDIIVFTRIR